MKMLARRAALWLSALLALAVPTIASAAGVPFSQPTYQDQSGYGRQPSVTNIVLPDGSIWNGSAVTGAASSTALEGTVTSTAATPTSGAATFASGTAYIGPLTPQLGRDIRVILKGTWAGSVQIGTASATNGCTAGNINPLTVAGQAWGQYTANANEVVDTPTLGASGSNAAPVYCATATITSGTLTYTVRQ